VSADRTSVDRIRRASLANIKQKLQTPSRALLGYGEMLIEEAAERKLEEMNPDLERIRSAALTLTQMVDRLLDENYSRELSDAANWEQAEKNLRHDLRTPMNGIKGYAEMLVEDLDIFGANSLRPDFDKLLGETNQLLLQLDDIVKFSRTHNDTQGDLQSSTDPDAAMTGLVNTIEAVDETFLGSETGYILVVDDIEANRDLLSRRLQRDKHRVAVAANGEHALEMLKAEAFDLVLLDLMMPGMNGFDVLRLMKDDPDLRSVPVIMISALDETDSVIRCIEAGAQDYLLKPFNPILLRARIQAGLESKQWSDEELRQKRFIRQAFSRFISPAVVDQLVANPSRLSLGGERREITCLFTDLADFTHLIETTEPSIVLPVLNRYLDGMCRIVLDHDGTIDKIVGDALHAFFGAPLDQPDHAQRAMNCALALDAYAQEFIAQPDARSLGFGVTRIGIHTGSAVVGNFGGESFFDYTAHGDVVNTAARMESVNKHLGTRICVTESTTRRCPGMAFRPIGNLVLKGKREGVEAFEPLTDEMAKAPATTAYLEGYELMRNNDPEAADMFDRLRKENSDDPIIKLHAERLSKGEPGITIKFDAK